MPPVIENFVVSFLTGLTAAASIVTQTGTGATRDWIVIASTGVIAFCGAFINGLRQLQKDPAK